MGELVHLRHSSGELDPPVSFLMDYLVTLIHTPVVSQFVLSKQFSWVTNVVSDTTSEKHFQIHDVLLLRQLLPLAPIYLDLGKPILQKLANIPPVLPLPYSCCPHLESYCPIPPFVFRDFPLACPWISWDDGFFLLVSLLIYCSCFIFHFHSRIYDQKYPLDYQAIGLSWWHWGGGGGGWTTSGIKISLTLLLKLLKKIVKIYNGNTTSCRNESILRRDRVKNNLLTNWP